MADLAAPDDINKELELCPKCMDMVPRNNPLCLEPGCPMAASSGQIGSDSAIYVELTRANLMRMRGQYQQAREQCLAILRRFPGNHSAHTLLGDICAEEGDLQQASEWYELALDLEPNSEVDRKKLQAVQARITEKEAAMTAKKLGLPASSSKAQRYAALMACFVVLVGIIGFFLGETYRRKSHPKEVISTPIQVTQSPSAPPLQGDHQQTPVNGMGSATQETTEQQVADDEQLLSSIRTKLNSPVRLLGALMDKRSKAMLITIESSSSDVREESARTIIPIFEILPDVPSITVRAVHKGQVVFLADLLRADLERMKAELPPGQSLDSSSLLRNEWSSQTPQTSVAPPKQAQAQEAGQPSSGG